MGTAGHYNKHRTFPSAQCCAYAQVHDHEAPNCLQFSGPLQKRFADTALEHIPRMETTMILAKIRYYMQNSEHNIW